MGPMGALQHASRVLTEAGDRIPADVAAVIDILNVAYESGDRMVNNLLIGARSITGHYVRPVSVMTGAATNVCEKCGHPQSGEVEWLKFV